MIEIKIKGDFLLDYHVRNLCANDFLKTLTISEFVLRFPKYFSDLIVESVLCRIAEMDPEMTMAEYVRIYEPEKDANASCMKCKNCVCGCSWSRSFRVSPNMIACVKYAKSGGYADGFEKTHIVYCKQFEEGKPMQNVRYDAERSLDLLCAYAKMVANDYRDCLHELPELREKVNDKQLNSNYNSFTRWSSIIDDYFHVLSTKEQCEFALGEKYSSRIRMDEGFKEDAETDKFVRKEYKLLNDYSRLPKREDKHSNDND